MPALLAVGLRQMFEYFNTRECHVNAPFRRTLKELEIEDWKFLILN
jgi:hypothetical protein